MKKFVTLLAVTASLAFFTSGSAEAKDRHRSNHSSHGSQHGSRHDSNDHRDHGSGHDDYRDSYRDPRGSGCQQGNGSRYKGGYHPDYSQNYRPSYDRRHDHCGPQFPSIGRGPFGLPGFLFGFGSR